MEDNYIIAPVVHEDGVDKVYEPIVKITDTLPIGTEVDYDGEDIPSGWEEIGDTVQATIGTTNPNNDRVWFKKTRNVWQLPDTNTVNGVTLTNNRDGTITLNGTATANADFYVSVNSSDYQNGIDYYLSSNINSSDITLIIANYNGNTYVNSMVNSNQQMPFTMNITNNKLRFIIRALSGKTFNNTIIKIQLEKGNEATSWSSVYMQPSINVDNEEIYSRPYEIWSGNATSVSNLDLTKYKYIEVLFKSNDNFFNSLKVKVPTTSTFSVKLALCNSYLSNDLSTATYIYFKYGLAIMTETGITIQSNVEVPINKTDSTIHWQGSASTLLYITSIIGYK